MSRENFLFAIVGLLLGFSAAFVFVTYANQSALRRSMSSTAASQGGASNGNQLPSNAVADQRNLQSDLAEASKKASANPNDFDAQMRAAELYYQSNRFDDALPLLQRANKLKPDDYDAIRALSIVSYQANKLDEAEKWCNAALQKKPDDNDVRAGLGLVYLRRQPPQVDRAIAEFKKALERDPRHEMSLQFLAVALAQKGDKEGARQYVAKLQEVNPSNPNLADVRQLIENPTVQSATK